ncbi:hypothetical protein GB937_010469 [Aspergillus fischeri]|nr:hypothetical protein GB937_010469 [Aspergillus fischeri]
MAPAIYRLEAQVKQRMPPHDPSIGTEDKGHGGSGTTGEFNTGHSHTAHPAEHRCQALSPKRQRSINSLWEPLALNLLLYRGHIVA